MSENSKGTNPFILGITNFTDLSYEEFAAQYLMAPQAVPKAVRNKATGGRRLRGDSAGRCAFHQLAHQIRCRWESSTTVPLAVCPGASGGCTATQADAAVACHTRRQLLQTYNGKTMATSNCSVNWGVAAQNPLGKSVVSPIKYQVGGTLQGDRPTRASVSTARCVMLPVEDDVCICGTGRLRQLLGVLCGSAARDVDRHAEHHDGFRQLHGSVRAGDSAFILSLETIPLEAIAVDLSQGTGWSATIATRRGDHHVTSSSTAGINTRFRCVQMLVDCSYSGGYDGCQGGWPTAVFDFAKANTGVASEAVDPYTRCSCPLHGGLARMHVVVRWCAVRGTTCKTIMTDPD